MDTKYDPKKSTGDFLDEVLGPATLGNTLAAFRECEGWTQAQLADKLGIKPQHVSEIERDVRSVSVSKAVDFAQRLGYPDATFVKLALQRQVDEVMPGCIVELKLAAG